MFEGRQIVELMQIAAAGGGFCMKAGGRTTTELMQIASAAASSGARITFTGLGGRTTAELMQIAAAGKGCIVFADSTE